jgi:single-strand DNA-binding protein
MIKLTAIGHLGKDAVVNNVNGKQVINFAVAHAEKYKNAQGEQIDKTIWIDCSYWTDKTAIASYLKKGTQVYVEGQPEATSYEKDGKSYPKLVCRVGSIQLLGSKQDAQQPQPQTTVSNIPQTPLGNFPKQVDDTKDDLPF